MKKHYFFRLLFVVPLVLISCADHSRKLQQALNHSNENRSELEKVLQYYSASEGDSLKLRAAEFLIANMPGHFTLGGEYMDNFVRAIDSLYGNEPHFKRRTMYLAPFDYPMVANSLEIQEDIKAVSADYLIRSIDRSFEVWEQCPWLRELGWDDFCEYLLPYRIWHEPLDNWKDSTTVGDAIAAEVAFYRDAATRISIAKQVVKDKFFTDPGQMVDFAMPDPRMEDYWYDCVPIALYEVAGLRSAGIPAAIDYVPFLPSLDHRHYWPVMIDPKYPNGMTTEYVYPDLAKVLRKTFSGNPVPEAGRSEYVPQILSDPFGRDVTEKYVAVSDIEIKPQITGKKPKYVYLAVFNDRQWQPVWWAELKGRKATFTKMGRSVMYLPVYYRGLEELPCGWPFSVDYQGRRTTYVPDTVHTQTMTLTRKFPADYFYKGMWNRGLEGSHMEASNDKNFKTADTIFVVGKNPLMDAQVVPVSTDKKYRYWRYVTNTDKSYLAELSFYDAQGSEIPLGPDRLFNAEANAVKMYDKDPLTFGKINMWVGFDFGAPVAVGRIGYTPRTDMNGVYPGDTYELLYWGSDGWVSMGRKVASDYSIEYENAPSNAVYWLRNLTEGEEERIFTYDEGTVRFW